MLKTQIIAKEVANLTDARYFAAWGVDYVSFNCNQGEESYIEPNKLKEIKDWIEGPKFLGAFNGLGNRDEVENDIMNLGLKGVVFGPFAKAKIIKTIDAEIIFTEQVEDSETKISLEDGQGLIIKTTMNNASKYYDLNVPCFLDIVDLNLPKVEEIVNKSNCGLVLKGGAEEKVGLKSYDFLDEVFDLLLD